MMRRMPARVLRANDVAMWSAGFDWLRVTLNADVYGQLAGAEEAYRTAAMRTAAEIGYTGVKEPWAMRGYRGEAWGKVHWGANYHSGLMLEATGWTADYAIGHPVPWTGVPRLDLQVTLWLTSDVPDLHERVAASSYRMAQEMNHRPWKVRTNQELGGGGTCYIGVRKESPLFVRVYDKMREAEAKGEKPDEWRNAWRFEVELKEGEGAEIYEAARFTKEQHKYVASYVWSYMNRRGIELPILNGGTEYRPLPKQDDGNTNERRLVWLNRYVAPTIDRMRAEGVPLERIVSALEITQE